MKTIRLWAGIACVLYTMASFAQVTQQVTALQYFYDTDPGIGISGNGAVISVTPTGNLDQAFSFPLPGSFSDGFHHLYVRAKDEFGRWSLAERRTFYVTDIASGTRNIISYQYYFDNDPGVGLPSNGAVVPVTSTVDFNNTLAIAVPGLSDGFHQLYLRTKDDLGRWSIAERRMFYVTDLTEATRNIISYQYYFDTDPGVGLPGNGAVVPVTSTVDFNNTLAITVPGLSSGFHQLYLRTKNDLGRWSIAERRMFYIISEQNISQTVSALEFYYDTDPGTGNGNSIPVTAAADINAAFPVGVPCLSTGIHYLYVRAQDEYGRWSIIERDTLQVNAIEICNLIDDDCDGLIDESSLGDGMIGHWQFDGNGDDQSSGNFDLTISGGPSFSQGKYGQGINLDGTGSKYAARTTDDEIFDFGSNPFTISLWVNFNSISSEQTLMEKFANQSGPGWTLTKLASQQLQFYFGDALNTSPLSISTGSWHHIAVTRSANDFKIYFDGAEAAAFTNGSSIPNTIKPLLLGRRNFEDGRVFGVNGQLDDAAIWSRGLSSGEISQLWNDGLLNLAGTYYADADGDGYGDLSGSVVSCTQPSGYVSNDDDCDDSDLNVHPDAVEICNGIDDNCNGTIDEEIAAPVISNCPADITLESETGQWGAHSTWTEPMASDNCAISTFTSSHSPGDFFIAGNTIVTYTAIDVNENSSTCSFNVMVNPPNILGSINLSIFANDIQFSDANPAPGTFINVSVTVHNNSNVAAASFVCHLLNQYDNTTYPDVTVPALAANQSTVVTWNIQTPSVPAFVPMQVTIDYLNNLAESNELDNQAIRPFVNGTLPFSGHIVVLSGAIPSSAIAGSGISICGNAYYADTSIPLIDSSVAGAQVTVTITETGQILNGVTNSNGDFCIGYSTPNTAGLYHFTASVTDFTLTGDTTGTFVLTPPPVEYCPKDLSIGMELYGSFLCGYNYHIVQGSSLTGIVHVMNSCQAISEATTLYISLPDGTPVPGPYIIPPLSPGETYSLALPEMTFNTIGSTYIGATVDFFNAVTEDNESNNSRSMVIQVHPPLPDIAPSQGYVSSLYQCTPASVSFRIENLGGVPTDAFNTVLEIYQGNTLETTMTQVVGSIPGLCYTYITFVFSPQFSNVYHFNLYCDTIPGVVTELSELNNSLSMTHYFQACNLDLVVHGCGSMDVKPTNPVSPGSITLYASIGNYGQLPVTTPFVVNFNVAGTIYPVAVNQAIPANGAINVTVIVPAPAFGNNDIIVEADANHEVIELNESNNTASAKLCWDFMLTNSKCNGGPPFHSRQFICNPIQLAIGVLNPGLYEASDLQVKFEVSGPGLSDWVNLGFATLFIDNTCGCPYVVGLPSGFLFPQTGAYQVRITADAPNLYGECYEDNNQLVLPVNVVENADYSVYSQFIAPSDLNPDINEPVTFNLTYKNEGCTGLSPIELYMQMDNTPHDSVVANALVSNATNTYSMSQPWSSALPGVHVIRSVIDHDYALSEGNELNNEATRSIIVGGAPNFNLFELEASNISPTTGETISLTAAVTNEGQSGADGSLQFYFVNTQGEQVLIEQQSIHLAEAETLVRTITLFVTHPHAKIIARVSNVDPLEYDFTDNEQQLQLNSLDVDIASTDVACNGIALGILEATVTGGQPPYFIQWSNGYTGDMIDVPAGIYSVLVTDVNGLTATEVDTVNALAIPSTWYADTDGDGYGNGSSSLLSCTTPEGYVMNTDDCNDANAGIHPLATEVCDGLDNNCDGMIDDADTSVVGQALWYRDFDGDTYGNPDIFLLACYQPSGYVGTGTDCDDNDASKHPNGNEVLDDKDNDCDGLIDEGLSVISVDAGDCMMVYHGYAPTECAVLNANVQGGTQPYTYTWSNGAHTASTIVCPEATSIYEVTVTDANGNTSQDVVTVQVINISCDNNKVMVCHVPPENPLNVQTICISVNAVATHLTQHGDYLGSCDAVDPCVVPGQPISLSNPPTISSEENHTDMHTLEVLDTHEDGVFAIYPNPANTFLELQLPGFEIAYEVTLHDVSGKLLLSQSFESGLQKLSTAALDNGIYIIQIISESEKMTSAIVVLH